MKLATQRRVDLLRALITRNLARRPTPGSEGCTIVGWVVAAEIYDPVSDAYYLDRLTSERMPTWRRDAILEEAKDRDWDDWGQTLDEERRQDSLERAGVSDPTDPDED